MEHEKAKERLQRYENGECSPQERAKIEAELFSSALPSSEDEQIVSEQNRTSVWLRVNDELAHRARPRRSLRLRYISAAAAAILLIIAISFLYTNKAGYQQGTGSEELVQNDVKPGRNQAILTLADGSKLVLEQSAKGTIARQQGVIVVKADDGSVAYSRSSTNAGTSARLTTNTLTTPRGGSFKITLPDGTLVWLNAASSLVFPVTFDGEKRREVTVTGEAYFEVSKDKNHPFVVHSGRETVEVLGTHFNINSYNNDDDQPQMITTLLEGSVKVISTTLNSEKILHPGQKAVLHQNDGFIISAAEPYAVAWKDGLMRFNGANIKTVMREVSRWYDLDVVYKGQISDEEIYAGLPRSSNLSTVLAVLRGVGFRCSIEENASGKRIIVQGK